MYYDIYDDIILLHKTNNAQKPNGEASEAELLFKFEPELIMPLLARKYKKIYLKNKCVGEYRQNELAWISPYVEQPYDSYYLCKENKKLFYGCVKTVFYNNRYSTDRQNLRAYVSQLLKDRFSDHKPRLAIAGSGISTYTAYLHDFFQITEYECNPEAYRFGLINKALNKIPDVCAHNSKYDAQKHEWVLAVIPSEPLDFQKRYNFETDLLMYYTCLNDALPNDIKTLCDHYGASCVNFKLVRPYSKLINTYFIHLCRNF